MFDFFREVCESEGLAGIIDFSAQKCYNKTINKERQVRKMEYIRMNFSVKTELKKRVDEILAKNCMNYSTIAGLFFSALIERGDLPFYDDVGIPAVPLSEYYRRHNIACSEVVIRIPVIIKERACAVIEKLSTTPSTIFELFLEEFVKAGSFPFETVNMSEVLRQETSNSEVAGAGKQSHVFNINAHTVNLTINGVPADVISGTVA